MRKINNALIKELENFIGKLIIISLLNFPLSRYNLLLYLDRWVARGISGHGNRKPLSTGQRVDF